MEQALLGVKTMMKMLSLYGPLYRPQSNLPSVSPPCLRIGVALQLHRSLHLISQGNLLSPCRLVMEMRFLVLIIWL